MFPATCILGQSLLSLISIMEGLFFLKIVISGNFFMGEGDSLEYIPMSATKQSSKKRNKSRSLISHKQYDFHL